MINLIEIGKNITKLRMTKKMSQQELADTLYVTHQAVSKWENGKSIPNIEILVTITKLFNISIDELLGNDINNKDDFAKLLTTYSREYVLNQLIIGKLDFRIEQVMYLLSNKEREIILSHILNQHLKIDLSDLLPYLNQVERIRIVQALKTKKLQVNSNEIAHLLTINERKQIYGGTK